MAEKKTATQSNSRNHKRNAPSPIPSREEFHRTINPLLSKRSFYPPDHWDRLSLHRPARAFRENTYQNY